MTVNAASLTVLPLLLSGCLLRDLRDPLDMKSPYTPPDLEDVVVDSDYLRILLVGDAGTCEGHSVRAGDVSIRDAAFERSVEFCEERGCDAVVLLGDNLYTFGVPPGGEQDADSCIGRWAWVPTGAPDGSTALLTGVLGNHDWGMIRIRQGRAAREIRWAHAFSPEEPPIPGYYWDRRFESLSNSLRIIGIDSEQMVARRKRSRQTDWLEGLQRSDDTWTLVVGHHPRYSQGEHGDAGAFRDFGRFGWKGKRFARRLDSALAQTGAHMYAHGHEHMLQYGQVDGVMHIGSGAAAKVTGGESRSSVDFHVVGGTHDPQPGVFWLELVGDRATLVAVPNTGRPRVEQWSLGDVMTQPPPDEPAE